MGLRRPSLSRKGKHCRRRQAIPRSGPSPNSFERWRGGGGGFIKTQGSKCQSPCLLCGPRCARTSRWMLPPPAPQSPCRPPLASPRLYQRSGQWFTGYGAMLTRRRLLDRTQLHSERAPASFWPHPSLGPTFGLQAPPLHPITKGCGRPLGMALLSTKLGEEEEEVPHNTIN